ncbi:MAG: deoxyribose-phosphate aldolase [Acholeplasmatales bacterium]|jgi:deoxyribose-phosphate aldolase|nr:deoxyribose-phosphate aldolase [Acholeplasmatales bacterium]
MELNKYIDHTKLGFVTTKTEIKKLCEEALEYNFKSVCVTPPMVSWAAKLLKGSEVAVCTVIGFPHGNQTINTKDLETLEALYNGAQEIDMVINVSELKSDPLVSKKHYVYKEISRIRKTAKNVILKVIIESGLLSDEEIILACELAKLAQADFVKTSTGYASVGATAHAVELMVKHAFPLLVKASGGIRTTQDALSYIKLGASRLGTSAGVAIVKGENNNVNTTY